MFYKRYQLLPYQGSEWRGNYLYHHPSLPPLPRESKEIAMILPRKIKKKKEGVKINKNGEPNKAVQG